MSAALSRRGALRGSLAASLGLVACVAPVLAAPVAANPDAALIAFAGCIAALARRQDDVVLRRIDAQASLDEWDFANKPQEPKWPKVPSRMVGTDLSTSTHRIVQWSEPLEPDPAQVAVDAALRDHRSACEAHRSAVKARKAASRVPHLDKVADRMWHRLIRNVGQLTDMEPATAAGLAAKASVLVALAETESDVADWWGQSLVRAVAEDAVRLGRGGTDA